MDGLRSSHSVRSWIGVVCLAALCGAVATSAQAAAGRTPGNFAVSASGAAQYSISLWAPAGIHGVQPSLALVYSSRAGDGYFGVGWSLSGLSSVYRCSKTWAQDGLNRDVRDDLSDRFCLDGNQLKISGGTYGATGSTYQTEIETFSRVTANGSAGNGPAYCGNGCWTPRQQEDPIRCLLGRASRYRTVKRKDLDAAGRVERLLLRAISLQTGPWCAEWICGNY